MGTGYGKPAGFMGGFGAMKLRMIQLAAVAVLLLFIVALMREKKPVDIPLFEVESRILNQASLSGMVKSDNLRFKRAYGLNAEDYQELLYYEPETNMDVAELLIVRVADSTQVSALETAMEKRIAVQQKNFDGYGTDQIDTLQDARIYSNDLYVCLVIAKDSPALLDIIRSVVEE